MNDTLNKASAFFDSMYGAPGVLVVLVTCNLLGYFLKMTSLVQNQNIPKWVVAWGILGNVLFRALPSVPVGQNVAVEIWVFVQHFGRLAAIGFSIGVVSTVLYDKGFKKLEEWFPSFKEFLAAPAAPTAATPEQKP